MKKLSIALLSLILFMSVIELINNPPKIQFEDNVTHKIQLVVYPFVGDTLIVKKDTVTITDIKILKFNLSNGKSISWRDATALYEDQNM